MVPANVAAQVFLVLCWLLALGWFWQAIAALRGMPKLPDLTRLEKAALPVLAASEGPHLAVVVPACNEERAIQATLRSLLASTGLRLEIIAVNDRSTDRTGERLEEIAAEVLAASGPHRLQVMHLRELPPGWLGKPHALALGAESARAPWLLFTDADVTFAPGTLALALREAMAERADHLVLMPTLIRHGIGEAIMQATVQALALWSMRLWKVAEPGAKDFFGVGGFNMVGKETFDRVGGMSALRMEVLEDMSLGWLVKQAGGRSLMAVGPGMVTIRWIEGILGIVKNIEKNGFAVFGYNVPLAALACLGLALQAALPMAALVLAPLVGRWALAAGLLTYLSIALTFHANRRLNGVSPAAALLFSPAAAIVGFGFLRSMLLTLWRNGVVWRGTLYPLSELRRNRLRWR